MKSIYTAIIPVKLIYTAIVSVKRYTMLLYLWNYLHCYYTCEIDLHCYYICEIDLHYYICEIDLRRLFYLWNGLLCYCVCETIYTGIISVKLFNLSLYLKRFALPLYLWNDLHCYICEINLHCYYICEIDLQSEKKKGQIVQIYL